MLLGYDYYNTPEVKVANNKVQTNPRYKDYTHLYYTVGDEEQFWESRTFVSIPKEPKLIFDEQKGNIFENVDIPYFKKYTGLVDEDVENTFKYIFNKFKKGFYIRIKDGEMISFIPFSKSEFKNEWGNLMKVDPKFRDFNTFFKFYNTVYNQAMNCNYKYKPENINMDPSSWNANNCVFNYSATSVVWSLNYAQIKSMFLELCKHRNIPDVEFFVNKMDFPILTKDGTEAYDHIFGNDVPLQSYNFERYLPILSMCTSNRFADIPIPTFEDWGRVKSLEGVYFPLNCKNYNFNFNLKWSLKKPIAIFRGANTGCGWNATNNPRLKLAHLGQKHKDIMDVGITNWNLRVRKHKDSQYLQIPDITGLSLVNKMTPEEQSNYKYIINVDGHVSAFRTSCELGMGSCILMVQSKWKMWFSNLLKPGIHYIPIKSDLSDLEEKIRWCIKHDSQCQQIAQNAHDFYKYYLQKNGIFDYLQHVLTTIREKGGLIIRDLDPLIKQQDYERSCINVKHKYVLTGIFPKNIGRNYGVLKAFETFIEQSIRPENAVSLVGVYVKTLFLNKKTLIELYQVGGYPVVVKNGKGLPLEIIHEAFIGKKVLNDLTKQCPNYMFTYYYREDPFYPYNPTVFQEYVYGPTLQQFVQSPQATFKVYLEILIGLACAIKVGQEYCGFIHHDLKPWNVIISILQDPIEITYILPFGIYKLKTRYIPVIIDYGKSRVIYNNVYHGIIDPYTMNESKDLSDVLSYTTKEFRRSHKAYQEDIQTLARFSNQDGPQNPFKLINTERLIKYLSPMVSKHQISFGKVNEINPIWCSNPRQLLDLGHSMNLKDSIDAYLNVPRRIYKFPLPQSSNRFITHMIAQKLLAALSTSWKEFVEFAEDLPDSEFQTAFQKPKNFIVGNVHSKYKKMNQFLTIFYTKELEKQIQEPVIVPYYSQILDLGTRPSRGLFLNPKIRHKLIKEIQQYPTDLPDYVKYKNMVLEVITYKGPFQLSDPDKSFYMKSFRHLFDNDYISKVIDLETLRFYLK
jgi:hypothetical protein